jgi:chitinase
MLYPSGNITYTPYPTGTAAPSVVYPVDVSSKYSHSSETLSYASASQSSVHYPAGNATTPCTTSTAMSSSTPAPVYGASTTPKAPVYGASSSPAPVYGASSSPAPVYGASSVPAPVYGGAYPPSVTSMPGQNYPSVPASSTVKVITTTYVDSCSTGVTTKTETITQTVCNKCTAGDSVTSVYVCNSCGPSVVTYTITKPATPATNVPSVPTMPAAKPSSPSYGGDMPAPPAKQSTPVYAAEKPKNTPVYGADKPINTPTYDQPKKQEAPGASTTVEIVYVTKTPVPVVPSAKYTPAPYPSAPAQNGTSGYPIKASGTGVSAPPSKPTSASYTPPAQFTGAASHIGVGMTGLLAVVAGLLVL